jgi:hypothetical protein
MSVQIPPELLLLIKMHNYMDVRNGLLSNGSQSRLCQRIEVWTSIIYLTISVYLFTLPFAKCN